MRFNLENTAVADPKSADRFNLVADALDKVQTELQAQINAAQEQFEKTFPTLVKDFFAAVPQIKSVTWVQYSPHFNDGDACTFSVHDVYFATDENEDRESYRDIDNTATFSGGIYSLRNKTFLTKEQIEICEKLDTMISCNENTMEGMFGDGYIVILRPNGIDFQEYDHD
jgi:hypothetical protein